MLKKSWMLLAACLLPCAAAAETAPLPADAAAAPLDSAVPATTAPMGTLTFHRPGAPNYFPLSHATFQPAGQKVKQPYIEKRPPSAIAAALPHNAAVPAAKTPAAPTPLSALQARTIHDIFDAE